MSYTPESPPTGPEWDARDDETAAASGAPAAATRSVAPARPPRAARPAPRPVWGFRPAPRDGGRDYGNPNVHAFDPGPEVVVRELLQNALDAVAEPDGCVEVTLRLIRLAGADKRDFLRALEFDAMRRHLEAAAAGGQKLGGLLRDGLARLDGEDLLLLVVEDRGTVGLTGPERGPGHFAALCRNNLDTCKHATAGGAFGLGKAACSRASPLATVVFHSHLSRPEQGRARGRLLGRCDLTWHELARTGGGATPFAGPGWFGGPGDDGAESIWADDGLAAALHLGREGAGTSLCIVGYHDPAADRVRPPGELAAELARAAARSFFPAMVAGRLAVRVELRDGRRLSWARDVDPAEYVPTYVRMLRAYRDGATVERAVEDGSVAARAVELAVPARRDDGPHGEHTHRAVLLVAAAAADGGADEREEPANRLVAFRGPGMAVQRASLRGVGRGARPLHALLLCGTAPRRLAGGAGPESPADVAAERFLREAEPPAHDRWGPTPGLRAAYAHGCVGRLGQFLAAAVDGVRAAAQAPAEGAADGPRSLRDLLRLDDGRRVDEGPRVAAQAGSVDEAGRWAISARLRIKRTTGPTRVVPAVYFVGEGGERVAVDWESLQADTPGCVAEGGGLRLPAGIREVRFVGITDPRSHPIPAADSCVAVGIEEFGPIKEVRS